MRAEGSTIWDASGRPYLDAAGGAVVVNVGHGRASIAQAMAEQAGRLAYAHGSAFTSEPLEAYAAELGPHLPLDDPAIYPVSRWLGGHRDRAEARPRLPPRPRRGGPARRLQPLGELPRQHHRGARPVRPQAAPPAVRGLARPVPSRLSAAYPYRAGDPGADALETAEELAAELDRAIEAAGPGTVAAFVGEPIVGATLAAAVPPDGYWPAIADVCRRHGVLLIADEVMTGFGRTGRWFGLDHWGVRPDILVAAKGATSGYWPFGFAAASGTVYDAVTAPDAGFTHGFTYSHHAVGAAVAREVLRILETESLVEASATKGERLRELVDERLADHPNVGEIRGRGLMVGIELVADRTTREPFARSRRLTEAIVRAARAEGLLLYSGTGMANGVDGDSILLGPPFVVTDEELGRIASGLAAALDAALSS